MPFVRTLVRVRAMYFTHGVREKQILAGSPLLVGTHSLSVSSQT